MATIFSQQTTDYDGSSSPNVGTGEIKISFSVNLEGYSDLQIMVRADGSSDEFQPLPLPGIENVREKSIWWSDVLKIDVEGLEYYYKWTKRNIRGSTATVTATLTEL